jgi:hypothetical protein
LHGGGVSRHSAPPVHRPTRSPVRARAILVTGCDHRYDYLLRMFLRSFADAGCSDILDIGIFDIDFTAAQKAWLAQYATQIVPARSPLEGLVPVENARQPLSSLVRPYLPNLFPSYDIYLYADVDVWVQDRRGLERYIEAAAQGRMGIAPQDDRAYRHDDRALKIRHDRYREVFGHAVADELMAVPHLNAGIFSLPREAPHWARWREIWADALERKAQWFGSGQAILTRMIYQEGMAAELMPALCNWQCHLALPAWDEVRRCYVEPGPPHDKILLMHMTANTKGQAHDIATVQGNMLRVQLTYPYYRRLVDGTA